MLPKLGDVMLTWRQIPFLLFLNLLAATTTKYHIYETNTVTKPKRTLLLWSTLSVVHCCGRTHRSRLSTASERNNRRLIVAVSGMWNATMSASGGWVTSKHSMSAVCLCTHRCCCCCDTMSPKVFTKQGCAFAGPSISEWERKLTHKKNKILLWQN